jgi:hypothetical protein
MPSGARPGEIWSRGDSLWLITGDYLEWVELKYKPRFLGKTKSKSILSWQTLGLPTSLCLCWRLRHWVFGGTETDELYWNSRSKHLLRRQRIDRCGSPAGIKNPQEAIGPLMQKAADEKTK